VMEGSGRFAQKRGIAAAQVMRLSAFAHGHVTEGSALAG
jgi:hypothetical protein